MNSVLPELPSVVKVICCDYFDTLVSRTINPEDVKLQWSYRLAQLIGEKIAGHDIYKRRAHIEQAICNKNKVAGYDLEFSAFECFASLFEELKPYLDMDVETFKVLCMDLELSSECATQILDIEILQWLEKQKSLGKILLLVSDFYIPSIKFVEMLRAHGIESLFDKIYVSADFLKTKRSGRLFSLILEEQHILPSQAFMLGDNFESDYKSPKRLGISAVHLDRNERHSHYQTLKLANSNKKNIENTINELLMPSHEKPFAQLALTLFCFTENLHVELIKRGIKDVLFLAREGQLLKKLFDLYQERRFRSNNLHIKTHYLEVSRRSTFLPSLSPLGGEEFEALFRQYRAISGSEFLSSLGLENLIPELEKRISNCSFSKREVDFPTSSLFTYLLNNEYFCQHYEIERRARRRAFINYLDTFGLAENPLTFCVVDVGWKGTIQDNLHKLFHRAKIEDNWIPPALLGMYLGLISSGIENQSNQKHGLLFSIKQQKSPAFFVFNENRALFEVILAADHGSALRYKLTDSGTTTIVRSNFDEEILFNSVISPLQRHILNDFQKINDALASNYYDQNWLLSTTLKHHARMVFAPTDEEIKWFTNIFHIENFGVFEQSTFGKSESSSALMGQIKFINDLIFSRHKINFGFWPWLHCRQQGGKLAAWLYKYHRTKHREAVMPMGFQN